MSSWGLGNTIFEITIFTWVFKYLVPKVAFFLTEISHKTKFVNDFSKISKTWFAIQNWERRNPAREPAKRLIFEFQKPASIWVLMEGFNFWLGTYNVPEGPSANPYGEARRAEFDGMDGWDGVSFVSFNVLHTLCVYRTCIYLLIYILKNYYQHSYGF